MNNNESNFSDESDLIKEAFNIVSSEDRSQQAMDRMNQLSDQATGQDARKMGHLFEAFLSTGGITEELRRTAPEAKSKNTRR